MAVYQVGGRVVQTNGVEAKLRARAKQSGGDCVWLVGFYTYYALWVHEDRTKYHAPPTKAGYLVDTARENRNRLRQIINNLLRLYVPLAQAVYHAAQWLLFQAKLVTPIDTGALRRSGNVTREA